MWQRFVLNCLIPMLLIAIGMSSNISEKRSRAEAEESSLPTVRCEPAVVEGLSDSLLHVELYIENVTELYGVDLRMSFDPTKVQVEDADPGRSGIQLQPLSDFLVPDFLIRNEANNSDGTLWYATTQSNPRPAVSGSGAVARVTFRAVQPAMVEMPFTNYQLARADGTAIPATSSGCQLIFREVHKQFLPLISR